MHLSTELGANNNQQHLVLSDSDDMTWFDSFYNKNLKVRYRHVIELLWIVATNLMDSLIFCSTCSKKADSDSPMVRTFGSGQNKQVPGYKQLKWVSSLQWLR